VIDPGPDLADHLDMVEVALGSADVAAVCITHHHADHASAAAELTLRLAAPLAATPESAKMAALDPPDLPVSDGSSVGFGGGHIEIISAPGHCADHVCFLWPEVGALFAGDVVLGEGTSMIGPPEGDMAAYLATLRRLAQLDLKTIYPGHGPAVREPRDKLDEYLRHRLEREAQVLEALAAGAQTLAQVRADVYKELDPRLQQAAERSVLAHLAKLLREGRVEAVGEAYRLAD
jgi:glyoxylase-like metal-dependent hydrolase (beta-lactamase superfamily II)